jgi:hypothetical protein
LDCKVPGGSLPPGWLAAQYAMPLWSMDHMNTTYSRVVMPDDWIAVCAPGTAFSFATIWSMDWEFEPSSSCSAQAPGTAARFCVALVNFARPPSVST